MGDEFYGLGVDIWSIGCIFAELFFNQTLFDKTNPDEMLWEIFKRLGSPDFSKWPLDESSKKRLGKLPEFAGWGFRDIQAAHPHFDFYACDLLKKMLDVNPCDRPTCQEILSHPYFLQ